MLQGDTEEKERVIGFINTNFSNETGNKMGTIAKQFREEGKLETKIEIAVNLYNMGNPIEVIAKATGLSIQMVKDAIAKANEGKVDR